MRPWSRFASSQNTSFFSFFFISPASLKVWPRKSQEQVCYEVDMVVRCRQMFVKRINSTCNVLKGYTKGYTLEGRFEGLCGQHQQVFLTVLILLFIEPDNIYVDYNQFSRQGNVWDRSADGSTTFSPVSRRPTVSWRTGGGLNSKRGCLLACFLKSCCSPDREQDMFQGLKLDLTPPYFLICFIKTNSFRVGEPPIMRKMRERLSERMVLNFNLRPRGNFLAIWFDFCQRVS